MEETLTLEGESQETVGVITALDEIFEKIEQLNARMEENQSEIDRLKGETKAILSDLRAAS